MSRATPANSLELGEWTTGFGPFRRTRFVDAATERAFAAEFYRAAIAWARVALYIGLGLGLGASAWLALHSHLEPLRTEMLAGRLLRLTVIGVLLWMTRPASKLARSDPRRFNLLLVALVPMLTPISWVGAVVTGADFAPDAALWQLGTQVFMILLVFSFLRAPLAWTVGWTTASSTVVLAVLNVEAGITGFAAVHMFAAILAGAMFAAAIERRERRSFRTARLLEASRAEARAAYALVQSQVRAREFESFEKSRVLAAVSHDLHQPLTALAMRMAALRHAREPLAKPVMDALDSMHVALEAIATHVNALGDVARTDLDPLDRLRLEPTDLDRLLSDLRSIYDETARSSGVRLLTRRHARSATVLTTSQEGLMTVMCNLVSNAIKFSRTGSRKAPWVLVAAVRQGEGVRIDVCDNGPGIPADEIDRVFEPYFRGRRGARRQAEGTGLGLAVVRATVNSLPGHSIALRSSPGRGCRFSVVVPATRDVALHDRADHSGRLDLLESR